MSNNNVAYFVSIDQVNCNIPQKASFDQTDIEITIDSVRYSLNSVYVQFIPPPSITALNVSSTYYYTLDEVIYVKLTGTNLDYNTDEGGILFVKVDNVVTVIPVVNGQTEVTFSLPKGLDVGVYYVYISTDG